MKVKISFPGPSSVIVDFGDDIEAADKARPFIEGLPAIAAYLGGCFEQRYNLNGYGVSEPTSVRDEIKKIADRL